MLSAAKHFSPSFAASDSTFTRRSWTRVSKRQPCPICHKSDFCEVSSDGQTVHCMRIASNQPLAFRQGGWLHHTGLPYNNATAADLRPNGIQSLNTPTMESAITVPLAPVNERHRAI